MSSFFPAIQENSPPSSTSELRNVSHTYTTNNLNVYIHVCTTTHKLSMQAHDTIPYTDRWDKLRGNETKLTRWPSVFANCMYTINSELCSKITVRKETVYANEIALWLNKH